MLSPISHKRCNVEFYFVWEIPRIRIGGPSLQRGVVLKWFYSPGAVGTPLSEVHALYRVPSSLFCCCRCLLSYVIVHIMCCPAVEYLVYGIMAPVISRKVHVSVSVFVRLCFSLQQYEKTVTTIVLKLSEQIDNGK